MTESPKSFRYPPRTRLIVVAVLAVAIGGFVVAGLTADTDLPENAITVTGPDGEQVTASADQGVGVESLRPIPGAESVLQQSEFVLDLEPGWIAEIVLDPSDAPSLALEEDELDFTPELDQYTWAPGDEKSLDRWPPGTNCVIATIWDQTQGRAGSERVVQWCFSVV